MNKTHLNNSGLYIDSPRGINNKKVTIDANNKDDNSIQYVITAALNQGQIKTNPQRINEISPFMTQYKRKDIAFPYHTKLEKF